MSRRIVGPLVLAVTGMAMLPAAAWSFRVQCPTTTITHPTAADTEPAYTQATLTIGASGYLVPTANVNGAIKCQQISGGDGYATMGDATQTHMFSFAPLSGLADIANGLPGTESPSVFNTSSIGTLRSGDPATTGAGCTYNGAVGQVPDADALADGHCGGKGQPSCIDGHGAPRPISDVGAMNGNIPAPLMAIFEDDEVFLTLTKVGMIMRPDLFEQHTVHFHGYPNTSSFYDGVPDAGR